MNISKLHFTFLLMLSFVLNYDIVLGQKHDNVWMSGYESFTYTDGFGGSIMEFVDDTIDTYYQYLDMNFDYSVATMCDTSGNLLFYTNGIYIC